MTINNLTKKRKPEQALPYLLSLLVLVAGLFFLLGGMVIPAIGSYY